MQEIQQLRQHIVQVEQQLRTVLSPNYLPNDREKALEDQQVGSPFILFHFSLLHRALKQQALIYTIEMIPTQDHHQDLNWHRELDTEHFE